MRQIPMTERRGRLLRAGLATGAEAFQPFSVGLIPRVPIHAAAAIGKYHAAARWATAQVGEQNSPRPRFFSETTALNIVRQWRHSLSSLRRHLSKKMRVCLGTARCLGLPLWAPARPRAHISAALSLWVPNSKWSILMQRRLSHLWRTIIPSGIGPFVAIHRARWARINTVPSLLYRPICPYPPLPQDSAHSWQPDGTTEKFERVSSRLSLRWGMDRNLIASVAAVLLLSACSPKPVPVVTAAGLCEGMRPAMPITYDGKADTSLTVKQIRQANSRFQAMCE